MSKKTILVFAHSSGFSGAERSLVETLHLIKRDFNIYVVVPDRGAFSEVVEKAFPGKVFIVKSYFFYEKSGILFFKTAAKQITNLFAILRCFFIAARVKPDLIYTNTIASWVGPVISVLSKAEHVWHLREIPGDDSVGRPIYGNLIERKLLSVSRFRFVANSRYTGSWYRKHRGIEAVVAYQPVSIKMPSKIKSFNEANSRIIRVGVFGRLAEEKRQHVIIRALDRLSVSDLEYFEVFFYGKGSQRYLNYLLGMVGPGLRPRVHFLGHLQDIGNALASTDLVIVPSARESFGRVTVEAMLFGVPVIGADSGGTSELIGKQQERGMLFPLDDDERLSSLMLKFKEDSGLFRQKAENASSWVAGAVDVNEYKRAIIKVFDV